MTSHSHLPKDKDGEAELRIKVREAPFNHDIPDSSLVGGFRTDWDAVTDEIVVAARNYKNTALTAVQQRLEPDLLGHDWERLNQVIEELKNE